MRYTIPTPEQVRLCLQALSTQQIEALATKSRANVHTLMKIRRDETKDPRLSTVHLIAPHVKFGPVKAA